MRGAQTGSYPEKDSDPDSSGYKKDLRSEAYLLVRRNDEGCSATKQVDFLRSHQPWALLHCYNHIIAMNDLIGVFVFQALLDF